jgi:hypothetical protein
LIEILKLDFYLTHRIFFNLIVKNELSNIGLVEIKLELYWPKALGFKFFKKLQFYEFKYPKYAYGNLKIFN